jgi:aldose sugar dehydrogenase
MPDGSIPRDNPFVGKGGARPEIWSTGHRNLQGAALDPETGQLWTTEHAAKGGDELNHPEAGKNYGWPIITWGTDYDGSKIGEGTAKDGLEQPVYYWNPSIGTSGLAFYSGDLFKGWKGNLLAGGLSGATLERLVLKDGQVVAVEHLLTDLGVRIRDVRVGAEGAVYVLTDSPEGKLLKLVPPN